MNNPCHYLSKNVFLIYLILIICSIFLIQCGVSDQKLNLTISRYHLIIVASKIPAQKDILRFGEAFIHDETAILPDKDSKLIIADCTESQSDKSIYIEQPCTPTQTTAQICDSATICKKVSYDLSRITFSDLNVTINCPDSIRENNIETIIRNNSNTNEKIYILSEVFDESQLISFTDTSYSHLFSNIDSLKYAIEQDILKNIMNIIVIYYPPTRKNENTSLPIFDKTTKKKKINAVSPKKVNAQHVASLQFKISTDNKTSFECTNLGQGFKYDYTIVDFDSPDQIIFEASGLKENILEVPSKLIKGRQYTLTVNAKKDGRGMKSKECTFSVDENGSIIQDCKK